MARYLVAGLLLCRKTEIVVVRFRAYWTLSNLEKPSYSREQDKEFDITVGEAALFVSCIDKSQGRTPNLLTPTYLIEQRPMGVVLDIESCRLKRSRNDDFNGPGQWTGSTHGSFILLWVRE